MTTLGLIGSGPWSDRYVDAARNVGVEIGDRVRGRDAEACQKMLLVVQAGGLDGVIVATEPDHQAAMGLACRRHNVPLLVEKPFGVTRFIAELALAQSWSAAAPFFVNYVHLWAREFLWLRRYVDLARAGD